MEASARSCSGTMRSLAPLPNTFTWPRSKSTLAASRPDASDTRAPHAYRNSSSARLRRSAGDCSRGLPAASRLPCKMCIRDRYSTDDASPHTMAMNSERVLSTTRSKPSAPKPTDMR